jgi:aspartokinase-like uncharacterized kinase
MWVVKLGGSLYTSKNLRHWLTRLNQADSLVIVPGGGPFADQVRGAQQQFHFDDSTAHVMALLAMEQFGRMFCGLQHGLVAAATLPQIQQVLARGETPVWMPREMVMSDPQINHSWDVTSDSLAAWLCGRLGVERLVLVKSLSLGSHYASLDELIKQAVVDNRFDHYLASSPAQAMVMAACDYGHFDEVYRGNLALTTRIGIASALKGT